MTSSEYLLQILIEIILLLATFSIAKIHYKFLNNNTPKLEPYTIPIQSNNYNTPDRNDETIATHPTIDEINADNIDAPVSLLIVIIVNQLVNLFNSWLTWFVTVVEKRQTLYHEQLKNDILANEITGEDYESDKETSSNSLESEMNLSEISSIQKQAMEDTAGLFIAKALCYSNKQEYKLAVKMLTRAAKLENPVAHYNLGLMYFNGKGVEKNLQTALNCFVKASSKGHAKSTENVKLLRRRNNLLK